MTLRSTYLAGLFAVGLAVTACSSSGGGNTPAPTLPSRSLNTTTASPVSTPPVVTSSSASTSGTAPSHDALMGIVAQQSDVPGYAPQAATPDDTSTLLQVVACVGSSSVNPADKIEKVQSDDFVQGQVTITSDASSYKSQAAVEALTALIQDPKAEGCLEQLLKQQVEATGATVDSVSLKVTANPGASGGPSNVVALLKGSITLTAQGQQATLNVAEAFITGRQLTATVSAQGVNTEPDLNALFGQVVVPVATRAAAA